MLGLVAIGLSLGAVACSGGAGTEVRGTGDEEPVELSAAERASGPVLDLAVELEQRLAEASPGSDITVAVLPVAMSLSQARSGAAGDTAAELDRVLHTPEGPDAPEQLASGLSSLDRLVTSRAGEQRDTTTRTGTVAIDLAQSLWLQKGTTIERDWLTGWPPPGARACAPPTSAPTPRPPARPSTAGSPAPPTTTSTSWRPAAPSPRPPASWPPGPPTWKAPWVTPFADTETRLAPFRHLDGVGLDRLDDAEPGADRRPLWRRRRLGGGRPPLPRPVTVAHGDRPRRRPLHRHRAGASTARGSATCSFCSLAPTTLDLGLPKFGFTTDIPLTDALRSTPGLTLATDPFAADFSGISTEPLSLTSVLHQTYLAIAEQGTEATATTPKSPATTPTSRATTTTTAPTTTASAGEGQPWPSTRPPPRPSRRRSPRWCPRPRWSPSTGRSWCSARDRPTGAALFYGRVLSPNG